MAYLKPRITNRTFSVVIQRFNASKWSFGERKKRSQLVMNIGPRAMREFIGNTNKTLLGWYICATHQVFSAMYILNKVLP
jgi:hypothetical protein